MARAMLVTDIALFSVWIVWMGMIVALRYCYLRLVKLLRTSIPSDVTEVVVRQGGLDPLEPVKWYGRLRRYVKSREACSRPAVSSICVRIKWIMTSLEMATLALLVMIVVESIAL